MKLHLGDTVKGKYRIDRELYAGGMGRVYLCTSTDGRKYVLKHPLLNGRNDDIKLEKLKVEAHILKTLIHPYIVKYVDSFEDHNMFYMVIEYIHGKDMKTVFKDNPAAEAQVRSFCEQLLSALEYLHNQNIIHRDIKPHNIMLHEHFIKLIDFGGAKMRFTSLQRGPTYLWSPGYGAPEQQAGQYYFQSDIYGVGTTMYFLLTGEDPCTLPPLSPRRKNPGVTRELDNIVKKATTMDPDKRFQTATEMKDTLLGLYKPTGAYNPRIIVGSKEFPVEDSLTLGRGGGRVHPDVTVHDPEKYLSKIHARVLTDAEGGHWIEDCSVNGTFVFTLGEYKKIKKWKLQDNDIIAFCWNAEKGPYITLKYKRS